MKVLVDPAVHGRLLQIPVVSIAQDAEAVAAALSAQAAAGKRSGSTINTVLTLQTCGQATDLASQPRYIRLATKCYLHSTVDGVPHKHTGGPAKLTPAALVTGKEVAVRLPPFEPAFCQQLSAAAAAGNVSLSVTLVEAGMAAGQMTSFETPAQQTPAVARIQLTLLPVDHPDGPAAAQPAAAAPAAPAATPAVHLAHLQPMRLPAPVATDPQGHATDARLVVVDERRLSALISDMSELRLRMDSHEHSSQMRHTQMTEEVHTLAATVHEQEVYFQLLQVRCVGTVAYLHCRVQAVYAMCH